MVTESPITRTAEQLLEQIWTAATGEPHPEGNSESDGGHDYAVALQMIAQFEQRIAAEAERETMERIAQAIFPKAKRSYSRWERELREDMSAEIRALAEPPREPGEED